MLFGALEAGGTKMVCAIGNEKGEIVEKISIPTKKPELTIPEMFSFYRDKEIAALGIGCFGPIDLNRNSDTYGYITTTPKKDWQHYDIVGAFVRELGIPVGFDTDVNASVLGEYTWGAGKGLDSCITRVVALFMTIASKDLLQVLPSKEDGRKKRQNCQKFPKFGIWKLNILRRRV